MRLLIGRTLSGSTCNITDTGFTMSAENPITPTNFTSSLAYANGLQLAYESWGDPANPTVLLIMGLGMQLIAWPDEFCHTLVDQGYRVVRFDNRDCGLSTKVDSAPVPNMLLNALRYRIGLPVVAGYSLYDMAEDTASLLDALGIFRAHVVGVSMGGMIGQTLAARHPDRVLSLTSIMSTTGARSLPGPTLEATLALLSKPRKNDLQSLIDHQVKVFGVFGSPAFKYEEQVLRSHIERALRRSRCARGIIRQLAAIMATGDRTRDMAHIKAPTLVIHGDKDPLVPVAAGRDTAAKIPGAKLKIIEGMGHDMAPWPLMAEAILEHIRTVS